MTQDTEKIELIRRLFRKRVEQNPILRMLGMARRRDYELMGCAEATVVETVEKYIRMYFEGAPHDQIMTSMWGSGTTRWSKDVPLVSYIADLVGPSGYSRSKRLNELQVRHVIKAAQSFFIERLCRSKLNLSPQMPDVLGSKPARIFLENLFLTEYLAVAFFSASFFVKPLPKGPVAARDSHGHYLFATSLSYSSERLMFPVLIVGLEERSSGGPNLCVFDRDGMYQDLGAAPELKSEEAFVERALEIICRQYPVVQLAEADYPRA